MKEFYILNTPKTWVKQWLTDGTWTDVVSVLVRKSNGKIIQIFGANSRYGDVGTDVVLMSDQTLRCLGYGTIIGYTKQLAKNTRTYVFK